MAGREDSELGALPIREERFVMVDSLVGVTLQTKERLKEVVLLGFQPVLVLHSVDKFFLNIKLEGEQVYQTFSRIINDANATIRLYRGDLSEDFEVSPTEGTVIFLAGTWGFRVQDFAKIYQSRYGSVQSKMTKRLWGDHFYDPSTNKWTTSRTGSATCQRGFERCIYDSIKKVVDNSIQDHKGKLRLMMQKLGHTEINLQSAKGEELFQTVMQIWLPASQISHIFREDPSSFSPADRLVDPCSKDENVDIVSKSSKGQKYEEVGMRDGGNRPLQQQAPAYGRKQQEGEGINDGGTVGKQKNHGRPQQVLGKNKHADFCLMRRGSALRNYSLPQKVVERLAAYQVEAVEWLWSLHCESTGGILADDMGMGKTRTVCSYLRGLLHSLLIKRAIVVAPKTVLSQWEGELKRVGLADMINMYRTPKSQGHSLHNVITQGGVLLTTYEVFRSKHKLITCEDAQAVEWDYVFLDEGHRVKNDKTQTSNAFSKLKCQHRIVITGTPFQNTLEEFYVLVDFCCPNLLGNEQDFDENFVKPIERAKYADSQLGHKRLSKLAYERLKELLKPYMIRRTKKLLQTLGLLGNKHELTVWLEMTTDQQNLYKALLTEVYLGRSKGTSFAEASVAKSICNHPYILRKFDSDDLRSSKQGKGLASNYKKQLLELVSFPGSTIETSCKMKFIIYLVEQLLKEEHKILIFSQSVPMLKLVEEVLLESMAQNKVIRMDGSTPQPERDEKIKKFQANVENPEEISANNVPDVFLMTTSVGGMGLNLTAASRVIIIDPSQNPSLDNQSVDRAFRLGQKKEVIVYRLITSSTIEEHTYRQQVIKGEVSTSVTGKKQCASVLEKELGKVLSLPKDGFGMSLTHKELLEDYYTGFEKSILEHVEFVKGHELVVGVNNHSSLFSVEESLPLPREEECLPADLGRSFGKKVSCDTVIGGEKQAYPVNDERWGVRNKMRSRAMAGRYTAANPLPEKLAVPGGSSCPEANMVHEGDARQMAGRSSRPEAGGVHERRARQMAGGSSRPEAGGVHERRARQISRGARSGDDPPKEPDSPTGPG